MSQAGSTAGRLSGSLAGDLSGPLSAVPSISSTNLLIAVSCVRRLVESYSGPLIRVERSSDSAQQDIGRLGVGLDEAALLAFCAGVDGRVVTGYDQSGRGNHITQAYATAPIIVSAGVLVQTSGSNPTMTVTGNRGLSRADACGLTGSQALTLCARYSTNGVNDPCLARIGASSFASSGAGFAIIADRINSGRTYGALFNHGNDFNVTNYNNSHYYVARAAAGAACSTYTMRQDGVTRTVHSVAGSGATVMNLTNQMTGLAGAAVSGSSGTSECNCLIIYNANISGPVLTAVESMLALHV